MNVHKLSKDRVLRQTEPIAQYVPCATQWKDISTAPKDGKKIDLWVTWKSKSGTKGKRVTDCYWDRKRKYWRSLNYDSQGWSRLRGETPTHWRQRPTPPRKQLT